MDKLSCISNQLRVYQLVEHSGLHCVKDKSNMEQKNFGYSLKNIPIPGKKAYLKRLIGQIENFIKRIRWKAYFFEKDIVENGENEQGADENYGFKSNKTPPQNDGLNSFENDLYELVRGLEYESSRTKFQKKLMKDVKEINSSNDLLVSADKTTNVYKMSKDTYRKMLTENITKTYKKADNEIIKDINKEAKKIAVNLKLEEKMESYADRNAFITLKDHKENFRRNPKCRLLNPAKSEVGLISKKILERINAEVRSSTQSNQWRSTASVIQWFKNIKNKHNCKFLKYDIVEFYPSISENLLEKALTFAKTKCKITSEEIEIINHARKSFLFDNNNVWVKNSNQGLFDVTMGSYDGCEVCELIGLFLLDEIDQKYGKEKGGLYRDDGLMALENLSGPAADRMRKEMIQLFKNHGLSITVETNLHLTDFLDVTFDLKNDKFYPYRKPNDTPLYINAKSNHPELLIKQLPMMINRRVSSISCNEEEFDKAKPMYSEALAKDGHMSDMKYQPPVKRTRTRKRNIIWFNPPFSQHVKTNIGKEFLKILDKNFPKQHKFHKLFNRNTVKISYCCMENMATIIQRHNSKVLKHTSENDAKICNCRNTCPMNGNGDCRKENVIYKASITSEQATKFYYGLSEPEFKTRYHNHTASFRNKHKEKETLLSKHIWQLKEAEKPYDISWSIVARATPYKFCTRH